MKRKRKRKRRQTLSQVGQDTGTPCDLVPAQMWQMVSQPACGHQVRAASMETSVLRRKVRCLSTSSLSVRRSIWGWLSTPCIVGRREHHRPSKSDFFCAVIIKKNLAQKNAINHVKVCKNFVILRQKHCVKNCSCFYQFCLQKSKFSADSQKKLRRRAFRSS